MKKKKKLIAANIILAVVAGINCFLWGMSLPPAAILWHNGALHGYCLLTLLSLAVAGACLIPSLLISEW